MQSIRPASCKQFTWINSIWSRLRPSKFLCVSPAAKNTALVTLLTFQIQSIRLIMSHCTIYTMQMPHKNQNSDGCFVLSCAATWWLKLTLHKHCIKCCHIANAQRARQSHHSITKKHSQGYDLDSIIYGFNISVHMFLKPDPKQGLMVLSLKFSYTVFFY